VNLVLVPALLLLVGLVAYKKVIQPKRGQPKSTSATTSETPRAAKGEKKPRKSESKRQEVAKARATNSGRMGSVL
jgi:hypothetical protein